MAGLTDSAGRRPVTLDVAAEASALDHALGQARQLDESARIVFDADLSAVGLALGRMRRAGTLAEVETAVLPRRPVEGLTRRGIPAELPAQLRAARDGVVRTVGAIYDDSGGVCVDSAELTPWTPGDWWTRAVVDDQRLCDGRIRSLAVRALGPDEVEATVHLGRLRRRTLRGRSLQLACDEARIVTDGVARSNPRSQRTFWSEPKAWRLALPN